jgi:hypothetical protein
MAYEYVIRCRRSCVSTYAQCLSTYARSRTYARGSIPLVFEYLYSKFDSAIGRALVIK